MKRPAAAAPQQGQERFVVGIGASAGGLEALQRFFRDMPADSGLAFVVVQHLDSSRSSMMQELLKRCTPMPVSEIEDGMRADANHVYTIPPNKYLAVLHGRLHLIAPEVPRHVRLPIDAFFRSLAEDQAEKAICIVLSGAGSDGSLGLRAIKGAGGMTMAQEESSARYNSMPHSAILSGCVDYVLPVEKMPQQLLQYIHHSNVAQVDHMDAPERQPDAMDKIFILLRGRTGHDFTYYKRNTIARRVGRRMTLHQIPQLNDYVRYLQQNKAEIDALFKELLIGVTSFFRDPEAFQVLKEKVLPRLFEYTTSESTLRVWVPGCSTGEEAYSIAMLFAEAQEGASQGRKVQIFATDIDEQALETARTGLFPASIAADVSVERLHKFFIQEDDVYQIKQQIREMVVLAKQDLIKDPPFSRLDLIVCRNLLIYLGQVLQKKLLPLFHYTLNPHGFMMLGTAESIGESIELFSPIDKKWKIFQRKMAPRIPVDFVVSPSAKEKLDAQTGATKREKEANLTALLEQALLQEHTPPCVIINERQDIVHFHGHTSDYLGPPRGHATLNILKMARAELRLELRSLIHKASRQNSVVVKSGVSFKDNGLQPQINLVVKPLAQDSAQGLMMVIFEQALAKSDGTQTTSADAGIDQRLAEMEYELNSTKESLQSTIEELETSNEELKSTNEELQSTNEELQSTNEELETSKEELQSVNEELVTVNAELQMKVDELSQTNNDMLNFLSSSDVAVVFLDRNLRIKRYTAMVCKVFNLIPADIGRPISHVVHNLVYTQLHEDIEQVIKSATPTQRQLQTKDGASFLMKIIPYRTADNVIEGTILNFIDLSPVAKLRQETLLVENALRYTQNVVDTLREPLLVLDTSLLVLSANRAYYRCFQTERADTEGRSIFALDRVRWDTPAFNTLLQDVMHGGKQVEDLPIEAEFPHAGLKRFMVNARKIRVQEFPKPPQEFPKESKAFPEEPQVEREYIVLAFYEGAT